MTTIEPVEILKRNLDLSIQAKLENFETAARLLIECYRNGGRLYIAGNGGSAADSQHLAAEFVSRLGRERNPLPAEALTVDTSIITAIGNDYGFEEIFARQIAGKMTAKDMFLGITTSGNSPNILRALKKCKEMDILSVVLSGHKGGSALEMAHVCILAPGALTSTIQEVHIVLAHTLCESVEMALFGSSDFA